MKFFIAIIVITAIALIGSRITFLNRRLPIGFRHILFTGSEYIFIGLILGPLGVGLFDADTLHKLNPFLLFGLTWVGFLFGLQFEVRLLRNLPKYYFAITGVISIGTFIIVSFLLFIIFNWMGGIPKGSVIMYALTLGAIASCTAQSALAIVNRNYQIHSKGLLELLRYITSVDGLFAVALFYLVYSLFSQSNTQFVGSIGWLILSIAVGILPGIVLVILSKTRFSQQEYNLFLVGTVLFCGGLSYQLNTSPLVAGLLCGFITANFCRHRLRALEITVKAEKSIYILLLLMVGALWQFSLNLWLLVGVAYFLIRLMAKVIGAYLSTKMFKPQYEVPGSIGLGLISEGGLAFAIILNLHLYNTEITKALISVLVVSVLTSELLAPTLIVKQFRSEIGTLKPRNSLQ